MVLFRVVYDRIKRSLARIATTLPAPENACTEYYGGGTVAADKINLF